MEKLNKKLEENKDIELIVISAVGEVEESDELYEECRIFTRADYEKLIKNKVSFISVGDFYKKDKYTRIPTSSIEDWLKRGLYLNIEVETYTHVQAESINFDELHKLERLDYLDSFLFGEDMQETYKTIKEIEKHVEEYKKGLNYKVTKLVSIPIDKLEDVEKFIKECGGTIR